MNLYRSFGAKITALLVVQPFRVGFRSSNTSLSIFKTLYTYIAAISVQTFYDLVLSYSVKLDGSGPRNM
jgi:hypothetical protein